MARAIVVPPAVLLCDEPTSALDVSLAATVLNLIGRLRRELGMAVLFVTHDLAAARVVADRIAVMYLGRIVEFGPADEVRAAPAHPYTRALLGVGAGPGRHARAAARAIPRARRPAAAAARSIPAARSRTTTAQSTLPHRSALGGDGRTISCLRVHDGDSNEIAIDLTALPRARDPKGGRLMAVAEPFTVTLPKLRRRNRPQFEMLRRIGWLDRVALGLRSRCVTARRALRHGARAVLARRRRRATRSSQPGHGGFLLGTDDVGRDIFSPRPARHAVDLVLGARRHRAPACSSAGSIGLVAGATGGWVDSVLMRFTDIVPRAARAGPRHHDRRRARAVAVAHADRGDDRVVAVLRAHRARRGPRARGRDHIWKPRASRARAASGCMFRHLLPGAVPSTIVAASLDVGALIITLSSLSFLGLGAPAPAPELGAMSARGINYLIEYWWVPVIPALAVFVHRRRREPRRRRRPRPHGRPMTGVRWTAPASTPADCSA